MCAKCAKSPQLRPTLCHPTDCSPPGSSVHRILQARILEWVAVPSSRGSFQPRDQTHISYITGGSLPLSHQGSPSIREVSGYGLVALTVPHQSASGFQNSSSPQEKMDFPSVRYGNMQGLCIDIYLDGSLLFLIRKSHPKETSCTQTQRVFPAISVNKGCHCHQQLQPPWMMSW